MCNKKQPKQSKHAKHAKQLQPSFEEAISQLEALVNSMENDTLPLEESLKAFEQGIHLTQICQQALNQAEQSIKILTEQQEEIDFEQGKGKGKGKGKREREREHD